MMDKAVQKKDGTRPEAQTEGKPNDTVKSCGKAMRYGEPCPYCGNNSIYYNGMLNLICANCGAAQMGAYT